MPPHQRDDIECALENELINTALYQVLTIPGGDHAFAMWLDPIAPGSATKVRDQVVASLDDHVKNPP